MEINPAHIPGGWGGVRRSKSGRVLVCKNVVSGEKKERTDKRNKEKMKSGMCLRSGSSLQKRKTSVNGKMGAAPRNHVPYRKGHPGGEEKGLVTERL